MGIDVGWMEEEVLGGGKRGGGMLNNAAGERGSIKTVGGTSKGLPVVGTRPRKMGEEEGGM
jgi:hypothetical protein